MWTSRPIKIFLLFCSIALISKVPTEGLEVWNKEIVIDGIGGVNLESRDCLWWGRDRESSVSKTLVELLNQKNFKKALKKLENC